MTFVYAMKCLKCMLIAGLMIELQRQWEEFSIPCPNCAHINIVRFSAFYPKEIA